MIHYTLSAGGQADPGCPLVEQFVAKKRLQAFDLRTDSRLGYTQRLRRLGKAAHVDNGDQCPQQVGRNIQHGLDRSGPTARPSILGGTADTIL